MKTQHTHCLTFLLLVLTGIFNIHAQTVSTFENLSLPQADFENLDLAPNSRWNGSDMPFGAVFTSGDAIFHNVYDTSFGGFWARGWAYSNMKDSMTTGFGNLFSAIAASGNDNSANYALGQNGARISLRAGAVGRSVKGFYVTNSTYTALSMRNGDMFAKKFGGANGDDPDWFKLTIRKWHEGKLSDDSVEFYLADYRFSDNAQDYILTDWQWVDLSSLGVVDSLEFNLSSSDVGQFGMNTPAFFCLDDFSMNTSFWNGSEEPFGTHFISGNAKFNNRYDTSFGGFWSSGWAYGNIKDTLTSGFQNLYGARAGRGYKGSDKYAIATNGAKIVLSGLAAGEEVKGFYVTNSTYTALSMQNGDMFAKKFGGLDGNDEDWFKLIIRKWYNGVMANDSVEFYLADYRFSDNSQDYIVNDWQWVDLSSLGNVDSLQFEFSSSDVGQFGMNTPAFFCMDDFTTSDGISNVLHAERREAIRLYPNPATTRITLDLNQLSGHEAEIHVVDMRGNVVHRQFTESKEVEISIERFNQGIYHIIVRGEDSNFSQTFIKL